MLTLRHAASSAIPIYEFEERTCEVFVLTGVYQHGPRYAEQEYGIEKIDYDRQKIPRHSNHAIKDIVIATVSNI